MASTFRATRCVPCVGPPALFLGYTSLAFCTHRHLTTLLPTHTNTADPPAACGCDFELPHAPSPHAHGLHVISLHVLCFVPNRSFFVPVPDTLLHTARPHHGTVLTTISVLPTVLRRGPRFWFVHHHACSSHPHLRSQPVYTITFIYPRTPFQPTFSRRTLRWALTFGLRCPRELRALNIPCTGTV